MIHLNGIGFGNACTNPMQLAHPRAIMVVSTVTQGGVHWRQAHPRAIMVVHGNRHAVFA